MSRRTDPIGDFVLDFALALAMAIIPAWGMSYWVGQELNPLGAFIAMASLLIVHGWLVVSTWHGRIALALVVLFIIVVGRFVPVGWPRRIAFLAVLIGWGIYVNFSPELLGDGLPA